MFDNSPPKDKIRVMPDGRESLEMMLGHLGFVFEVHEEEGPMGHVLHIHTRDSARLVGRDGRTLDDLQYLVNRLVAQGEESTHYTVDVDGYRTAHLEELLNQAKRLAQKVLSTGRPLSLPPLNSFDRRIIHQQFKEDPQISSSSPQGPERLKKITLTPRQTDKTPK